MRQRIHGLETELIAVAIKPGETQNIDVNPTIEEFLFRPRKIYGNFNTCCPFLIARTLFDGSGFFYCLQVSSIV
jgi:hypothetical protein